MTAITKLIFMYLANKVYNHFSNRFHASMIITKG